MAGRLSNNAVRPEERTDLLGQRFGWTQHRVGGHRVHDRAGPVDIAFIERCQRVFLSVLQEVEWAALLQKS